MKIKDGTLWIGTWGGWKNLTITTNTFTHYKTNLSDSGNDASNIIRAICEDKFGVLWIGTSDGLFRFNKSTKKFESFRV
jgi:ligand-binding sensor domain-containing protein